MKIEVQLELPFPEEEWMKDPRMVTVEDLKRLDRYFWSKDGMGSSAMGNWVAFEDVEALLKGELDA